MPFYILSTESSVKNNEYKFGYSSKTKDELLFQYSKNKRTIVNPFILEWWNKSAKIKDEKKIHNILRNTNGIYNISGEWYRCNTLLYLLTRINIEIEKIKPENKNNICEIHIKENIFKENNKKISLILKETIIDIKKLENQLLIDIIDSGEMLIKYWPLKYYEKYSDIINYKIIYFHIFYMEDDRDTDKVLLFYKINNEFKTYKTDYNTIYKIFIREFDEESILKIITKYYKKFDPLQN